MPQFRHGCLFIAATLILTLAGCNKPADPQAGIPAAAPDAAPLPWQDPSWDAESRKYVGLFIDGETGCQFYVSGTTEHLQMTKRTRADGTQICKPA